MCVPTAKSKSFTQPTNRSATLIQAKQKQTRPHLTMNETETKRNETRQDETRPSFEQRELEDETHTHTSESLSDSCASEQQLTKEDR